MVQTAHAVNTPTHALSSVVNARVKMIVCRQKERDNMEAIGIGALAGLVVGLLVWQYWTGAMND